MNTKVSKIISRSLTYAILLAVLVITVYPVVWMISGSLKSSAEFYTNIWGLSKIPQWHNYFDAWKTADIGQKYLNSIFVIIVFMVIIIPVNNCAAYAIARLNFKGRKSIYTFLLIGIMIPGGVLAIPIFSIVLKMGLVNSLWGLVIVYAAQAVSFGIFILRSFYISLPKSLEEAAKIDGCGQFGSFVKIIMPLAIPGIMTQVIFNGLTVWNEYFLASIIIRTPDKQTLPIGLSMFISQYGINYPQMFAALVCVTLPMIIIYLIGQKTFIEGLSAGAVKG